MMHLAKGRRHFFKRHRPIAAPSAACADGTVDITSPLGNGAVKAEKLNVTARRDEAAILLTRSKISSFLILFDTVRSSKRSHFWALRDIADLLLTGVVLVGAKDQESVGAKDAKASKQYFMVLIYS